MVIRSVQNRKHLQNLQEQVKSFEAKGGFFSRVLVKMPNRDIKGCRSKEVESTLLFKRRSHEPISDSKLRHEHTLKREWAGTASPTRQGTEHGAQRANNSGQGAPDDPVMMQRWLGDDKRDQPYNNIGSFFAKNDREQKKGQAH